MRRRDGDAIAELAPLIAGEAGTCGMGTARREGRDDDSASLSPGVVRRRGNSDASAENALLARGRTRLGSTLCGSESFVSGLIPRGLDAPVMRDGRFMMCLCCAVD